jgi:hypothetical protein
MTTSSVSNLPERMNGFMTTEHFTLQAARSIVNGEIMNRINIYFTVLSSVLIAAAFLAQRPELSQIFQLFAWIAFPALAVLGLLTFARLVVLANMDFVYLRALNRVRHFYVQATPETQQFLLFPPYDDDPAVRAYGGYSLGFRGNLLSAGGAVIVINCILTTVLLSALISLPLGIAPLSFLPFGIAILVVVYFVHVFIGLRLAGGDLVPDYREVRFPTPPVDKAK